MEEPELIFIAKSRYGSKCRTKDCLNSWNIGDPFYWNSKTREAFCEECGDSANQ